MSDVWKHYVDSLTNKKFEISILFGVLKYDTSSFPLPCIRGFQTKGAVFLIRNNEANENP